MQFAADTAALVLFGVAQRLAGFGQGRSVLALRSDVARDADHALDGACLVPGEHPGPKVHPEPSAVSAAKPEGVAGDGGVCRQTLGRAKGLEPFHVVLMHPRQDELPIHRTRSREAQTTRQRVTPVAQEARAQITNEHQAAAERAQFREDAVLVEVRQRRRLEFRDSDERKHALGQGDRCDLDLDANNLARRGVGDPQADRQSLGKAARDGLGHLVAGRAAEHPVDAKPLGPVKRQPERSVESGVRPNDVRRRASRRYDSQGARRAFEYRLIRTRNGREAANLARK